MTEIVNLNCDTSAADEQDFCASGYTIEVRRNDGQGLSEMELRSMLTQTIWALEGESSLVTVARLGGPKP